MLETLKSTARAVEAVGRGDVELYFWKRITESKCGGTNNQAELAKLEDVPLKLSQLDHLPGGWLQDGNDWDHVFAEIVSPEITLIFEKLIAKMVSGKQNAEVHAGPPKTLSRTLAKGKEYQAEFLEAKLDRPERWTNFAQKFQETFGRSPSKANDFV